MRRLRFLSLMVVCLSTFMLSALLHAQQGVSSSSTPRITQSVDEDRLVPLSGQMHPLALAENDQGAVPDSLPLPHMLLLLQRSPEQEAAFEQLINEMHDPGSPNYQQWLTAAEIGERFGPAQADVSAVTVWLQSHGFQVNAVYPNGTEIDISGTAGQVSEAFHTEIHYYNVNGQQHIANSSAPSVPAALAPVVVGFSSLNDIWPSAKNQQKLLSVKKDPESGGWIPSGFQTAFTTTVDNEPLYLLSPLDFGKIYNVQPLWNAAKPITGKGQTIAILAGSDIKQDDWNTFRAAFGLSSFSGTLTQVHPPTPAGEALSDNNNCVDPGLVGVEVEGRVEGEAALDTEWSSAVAPDARIVLASCANTATQFSFLIAANNLINGKNPPPIISVSIAGCEQLIGPALDAYVNGLWEQGAAEGITLVVGSGDNGPAQCDSFHAGPAFVGLAVSTISSTIYNVSVGGIDYQDAFQRTEQLYWSQTNSNTGESVRSYVPEMPWNDSCANSLLVAYEGFPNGPAFCNSGAGANFLTTAGGGGGASILYTKPVWQAGVFGIPSDGRRDLPDIAFPSANLAFGHAMLLCMSDPNGLGAPCVYNNPNDVVLNAGGGTSFGGPMFAGVQALINQKAGGRRQGVSNFVLYKLGAGQYGSNSRPNVLGLIFCDANFGFLIGENCVFHDVSTGDNSVPCVAGSPNCYAMPGAAYGVLSTSTVVLQPAFQARPGWDFATGLGSPNVANLVNNWPTNGGDD